MRFPPLHNTHPITIEINPSLKTSPAFIHIIRSAVVILSRSSSSSRRNPPGKMPHFASSFQWPSYWTCCLSQSYRQKSSSSAGQSGHGYQIINQYKNWHKNSLVWNNWNLVHVISGLPPVLTRFHLHNVERLTAHVYSETHSFVSGCLIHTHTCVLHSVCADQWE